MRPRDLDELAGQSHLLEPGSALRIAIESGEPHSAIFYGPPGTGKTTVARIIAARAKGAFEELSAVNAGRPEVREVIARARERRASGRPTRTVCFLMTLRPPRTRTSRSTRRSSPAPRSTSSAR